MRQLERFSQATRCHFLALERLLGQLSHHVEKDVSQVSSNMSSGGRIAAEVVPTAPHHDSRAPDYLSHLRWRASKL